MACALIPAAAGGVHGFGPCADLCRGARRLDERRPFARCGACSPRLSENQPDQIDLARKALTEAIGAGQMELALSVATKIPAAKLPTDARLLLVADEVKRRQAERAVSWLLAGSATVGT